MINPDRSISCPSDRHCYAASCRESKSSSKPATVARIPFNAAARQRARVPMHMETTQQKLVWSVSCSRPVVVLAAMHPPATTRRNEMPRPSEAKPVTPRSDHTLQFLFLSASCSCCSSYLLIYVVGKNYYLQIEL